MKLEQATQALRQLGFKTRAARRALEQARAHVGSGADVPILVKTVLAARGDVQKDQERPLEQLARQALMQAGFSPGMAAQAVARARAHVGTEVELAVLIKEALRHCR